MAVNICSLSRETWVEVRRRLEQHVAAGRTGDFYEVVFSEMTSDGCMAAKAVMFPTERWYEIDTVADLHAAELVFPTGPNAGEAAASHARTDGARR